MMPSQSQRYDRDSLRHERRQREQLIGYIATAVVAVLIGGLVLLLK
jgi:hypothetical protein